ncbi:hypothetical protein GCM10028818_01350 [Spirosoma horti]
MKKVLKWIGGIFLSVILILGLIGYLSGPAKPEQKSAPEKTVTKISNREVLDDALGKSDVTLCKAYNWISEMEAKTRKDIETKHPDMNIADRIAKLEQIRDQKWNAYCAKANLPVSMRPLVNAYGFEECK